MHEQLKERLTSSRTVFEGRLLTVRVDKVELAGGGAAEREVVHHPGAVAIVALLADDRVVMIRHYRHAAGEVLWELPAGVQEPGEDPLACGRRELIEETGYEPGELTPLLSTFLSPGFSSEIIHLFLARRLRQVGSSEEPDERIEVHLLPLDEAVGMVLRGEVRNAAAICGLLAASERRRGESQQEVAPIG
jgi:ADP-ribose pyrophosphatase